MKARVCLACNWTFDEEEMATPRICVYCAPGDVEEDGQGDDEPED